MQLLDKKHSLVKDAPFLLPFQGTVSAAVSARSPWRKVRPSAALLVLSRPHESRTCCCCTTSSSSFLQPPLPVRIRYWSPKLLIPLHVGLDVTIAGFPPLVILCPYVWPALFSRLQEKCFGEWNYPAESWDVLVTSVLIKLPFCIFGSQASRRMSNQLREQFAQSCETAKPVGSQAMNVLPQFCFQPYVHHAACLVGWFWSLSWAVRCSPWRFLNWEPGLISCAAGVSLTCGNGCLF